MTERPRRRLRGRSSRVAFPPRSHWKVSEMLVLVKVGPLLTAVTCGFTRASPIHASKMCVTGVRVLVQPPLRCDRTRMTAASWPAGNWKNWNGAPALYGACATAWAKQLAVVMRHVMIWFGPAGAESRTVKSIGFPAAVLEGLAVATDEKPWPICGRT